VTISGFATQECTSDFAKRHEEITFLNLGESNLKVSAAGFGGYRIAADVAEHAQALRSALLGGVNLIDTSANYTDGKSERLIGQVLSDLIRKGDVERRQIVVVSKVGYLQGENFALSRKRAEEGRPFPELVLYDNGLEHCIHPLFIEDQLTRSLDRLGMETLDVYLLHNPEYYLGWAHKHGEPRESADEEYYRRIKAAFVHLESEVARGRIRAYGVSSNTFPVPESSPQWTSLHRLLESAADISAHHHFRAIQLPFNLLETGAVLEGNQPDGRPVLALAAERGLGVLINRPLNAIAGQRMLRLADIPDPEEFSDQEITDLLTAFKRSEKRFMHGPVHTLNVPLPLKQRIADQLAVADHLIHYWRNIGSYERWRDVRSGFLLPRVMGVIQFLRPHAAESEEIARWIESHLSLMEKAQRAIESVYAAAAIREVAAIKRRVRTADTQWARAESLSQMAIRAVRSTAGISCVLVGMRRPEYVNDVLAELRRPIDQAERHAAWRSL
jgi:hypothetical protein